MPCRPYRGRRGHLLSVIAGPHPRRCVRVVRQLNQSGVMATVDVLENAAQIARPIPPSRPISSSLPPSPEKLDSNISVKLTALGLKWTGGMSTTCGGWSRPRAIQNFVGSTWKTRAAPHPHPPGSAPRVHNVGVVIRPTCAGAADVEALTRERADLRLCKGISGERSPTEIGRSSARTMSSCSRSCSGAGPMSGSLPMTRSSSGTPCTGSELRAPAGSHEFQMLLGWTTSSGESSSEGDIDSGFTSRTERSGTPIRCAG